MATQTKLWQLENSLIPGSILVTDASNENIHFSPGTLGQFLRVGASGLPEWNTFSVPSEYEQVATPAALPVTGNSDVIYLVADRGDGNPEFQVWTGTAYLAVPTNPILNFNLLGQAGSPQSVNQGENINFSGLNGFSMSVGATNQVYVNPPVGTALNQVMGWNNTTNEWEVQTLGVRPFAKYLSTNTPTAFDTISNIDTVFHKGSLIIGSDNVIMSTPLSGEGSFFVTPDSPSTTNVNSDVKSSIVIGSGVTLTNINSNLIISDRVGTSTILNAENNIIQSKSVNLTDITNCQILVSDLTINSLNNSMILGSSVTTPTISNDSFNIVNGSDNIVKFDYLNDTHFISGFGNGKLVVGNQSSLGERVTIKSIAGLNNSGLMFEDLTSSSPNTVQTSYLAVDATGLVVKGAAVTPVPNGSVTGQQLIWNGTAWVNCLDRSETFTGITIATVTLANTPKVGTFPDVYLNGIFQTEGGVDYTISGTSITFVVSLVASDRVSVRYKA